MTENTVLENNKTAVESKPAEKKLVFGTKINETEEAVEIVTEAAGYNKDNLEITVESNVLTITSKPLEDNKDGRTVVLREFSEGDYKKVYRLSDKIDIDIIKAEVRDGVLRLTLPKVQPPEKRRIEVKAV